MKKYQLTAVQEKIYMDKEKMSDNELIEYLNNPKRYFQSVVFVAKIILTERGVLKPDPESSFTELETEAQHAREKQIYTNNVIYNIDGPPYNNKFKSNSTIIIIVYLVLSIIAFFIEVDSVGALTVPLILSIITSLLAIALSFEYLDHINRGFGFSIICFFNPLIGLLIIRNLSYGFNSIEEKKIYNAAVSHFEYISRQPMKEEDQKKYTKEDIDHKLITDINEKVNNRIQEYYQWLLDHEKHVVTDEEKYKKVEELTCDLVREQEVPEKPDITTSHIDEVIEADTIDFSKPFPCPACSFEVQPDQPECPDCGLAVK